MKSAAITLKLLFFSVALTSQCVICCLCPSWPGCPCENCMASIEPIGDILVCRNSVDGVTSVLQYNGTTVSALSTNSVQDFDDIMEILDCNMNPYATTLNFSLGSGLINTGLPENQCATYDYAMCFDGVNNNIPSPVGAHVDSQGNVTCDGDDECLIIAQNTLNVTWAPEVYQTNSLTDILICLPANSDPIDEVLQWDDYVHNDILNHYTFGFLPSTNAPLVIQTATDACGIEYNIQFEYEATVIGNDDEITSENGESSPIGDLIPEEAEDITVEDLDNNPDKDGLVQFDITLTQNLSTSGGIIPNNLWNCPETLPQYRVHVALTPEINIPNDMIICTSDLPYDITIPLNNIPNGDNVTLDAAGSGGLTISNSGFGSTDEATITITAGNGPGSYTISLDSEYDIPGFGGSNDCDGNSGSFDVIIEDCCSSCVAIWSYPSTVGAIFSCGSWGISHMGVDIDYNGDEDCCVNPVADLDRSFVVTYNGNTVVGTSGDGNNSYSCVFGGSPGSGGNLYSLLGLTDACDIVEGDVFTLTATYVVNSSGSGCDASGLGATFGPDSYTVTATDISNIATDCGC